MWGYPGFPEIWFGKIASQRHEDLFDSGRRVLVAKHKMDPNRSLKGLLYRPRQ